MEPKLTGNKQMPDFNKLTDRIIAEKSPEPTIVIKTNLDPKDPTENNPYFRQNQIKNPEEFKEFFDEQ